MILKQLRLFLGITLLLAQALNSSVALAATATGRLSCMDSTTTSILIYVEFSGAGTTGANLYRYGAAHAIATYPNKDSGKGSFNDTGLSVGSTYHYELHSGTLVLAKIDCSTKPAAVVAPAPSPTPTPTATVISPTPAPAPAPATTATPTAKTAPAPAAATAQPSAPADQSTAAAYDPISAPTPDPNFDGQTDSPIATQPVTTQNDRVVPPHTPQQTKTGNKWLERSGLVAAIIMVVGSSLYLFRRLNNSGAETSEYYYDFTPQLTTIPVPTPAQPYAPAASSNEMLQSINEAFYPNLPPPIQKPDPDLPEDMYEVASKHPESFGNVHYADNLTGPQPAEPSIPLRMTPPQPASQLHSPSQPVDPYSDRTKLS